MKIQLSLIKKFMLLYVVYISLLFILVEHKFFQSLIDINGFFSNSVTYFLANILELFVPLTYDRYFIHLPYVFVYHHSIFDITHDYITQNIMIVFVFLVFVVYLNWIGEEDESKS